MIAKVEDKIVEFFEFALDIIQMYDSGYHKKRYLLDQHSRKTGQKPLFQERMEYIINDFKEIVGCYVSGTSESINEINLAQIYLNTCSSLHNLSPKDYIVSIGEGIIVIYNSSIKMCSII